MKFRSSHFSILPEGIALLHRERHRDRRKTRRLKMTRFELHTVETAPEGSKAELADVTKAWGFTPKLQATLAESPAALIGYDTLFGLVAKSTLTPVEQQVAYLSVSVFHGCEYCTMGHTYLGRTAGMEEAEIAALRAGDLPADPKLAALARFTRAVVATRGHAGDSAVEAVLAAGFTQANVLDVVAIIATKTISNYTNHLTHTPKESFMSDPSLAWTAPATGTATK
jgi:AhpD family alkylhydroperoxidase